MTRHGFPLAVHLLLHNDGHEILFQRRSGTGYADGFWSLPAGHVEPGERMSDACLRECREELGLALDATAIRFALLQQKHDDDGQERIDAFFAARMPAHGTPTICEPHRCDGLSWARIDAPPGPLVPYVANALVAIGSASAQGSQTVSYYGYPPRPRL